MATNNRDVELGITVTTTGSENIKRLKDEVEALAKEGGAAAPEFSKLADELDRLGAQATALEAFDQIGRDIEAMALAENTARKATADLSVELAQAAGTADHFRQRQAEARTELEAARKAQTDARIALAEYKNSTEAADASTEVYQAKVRTLTTAVIDSRKSLSEKVIALREVKEEAKSAEAEEAKLERAYNRSADEARKITTALSQKEQAQRDQVASLRQLGVETDNLRAVDVSLINAMNAVQAETNELVAAQNRAADAARRQADEEARLAIEAKAAAQSYVNFWIDALNRREEAEKATAAATKAAADAAKQSAAAIQAALGTVGVKSAEELRLEIQRVRDSLTLLGNSGTLTGSELDAAMNVGQRRINELERQIREATGQLTLMDKAAGLLKTTIGQLAGFIGLAETVQRTGMSFLDATRQIEAMRGALTQIYGSTDVAAKQIEFLRKTANTAGLGFAEVGDAFTRFAASTAAANVPLEVSNGLFAAVTRAAGLLGLSSDKAGHALDALSQIAAKNVVSMEELRQQLGDSLPGAFAIAAKGLGLTTAELVKLVETGSLTVDRFFPAFKKGLEDTFGSAETSVEGLFRAWNRLRNAFRELYQEAADSTALKVLSSGIDLLATNLKTVTEVTYGFGKALLALKLLDYVRGIGDLGNASRKTATDVAAKTAAVVADTSATAANTAAITANTAAKTANANASRLQVAATSASAAVGNVFVGAMDAATTAVTRFGGAVRGAWTLLGGLPGLLVTVALNARELGTWIGESIAKWTSWGKVLEDNEKKLKAQAEAEQAAAKERQDAQMKADQAFQREVVRAEESRKALEGRAIAAEKATQADKVRADGIEKIAALYGTETERSAAAVKAIEINVAASEKEAAAKKAVFEAASRELEMKDRLIAASTNVSEKLKDETQKLRDKVASMREESAEATNTVRNLQIEAAQRKITSESVKDNSDKVDAYKDAMLGARENLKGLLEMQKQGLPVSEALAKAEIDLAVNTRLYSDAVADKAAKQKVATDLMKAEMDVTVAQLSARKAELESMRSLAQAAGDSNLVRHATIELKRVEIDIIKAQVAAGIKEQEGIIAINKLKLEEMKVRDPANKLAIQELETTIKIAEAKIIEQKARGQVTEILERELIALRNNTQGKKDNERSAKETAGGLGIETAARFKNTEQIERENDALAAQNNLRKVGSSYIDSENFVTNAKGERFTSTGQLTIPDGYFFDAAAANRDPAFLSGQIDGSKYVVNKSTGAPLGSAAVGGMNTGGINQGVGGVRTIRLQIGNGTATNVNVASDQDAANLESFLSQLQAAQGTSV